jgi:thiol-disulfide isomerase/thioredoxin
MLVLALASAQSPDYSKSVATVLVFTTTDCPISNRYAPEIKRLAKAFKARGVEFLLVYPVPTDTPAIIRKHQTEFAYDLSFTRDPKQALVKFSGVTVTPEVAVVNRRGKIVYRGRIDDRYVDFGKERLVVTTHDLEDGLNAVVNGKPVRAAETQAVGCYLPDLIK